MKFDRMFSKVEKFDARALTDPFNHERREKRMIQRKAERWNQNYTYFFGGLTEEEQQYRDYFQTDIELDPENGFVDDLMDQYHLAQQGEFNPALYDFQDYTGRISNHETYEDVVDDKLFKFKYRQMADDPVTFERRNQRMIDRFMKRAHDRDPALEQNLEDLFTADARDYSLATLVNDPKSFRAVAKEETRPFREYMLNESVQQYKDYYESDAEEQTFFEYLDNLPNRDRIRFMEVFEDFTVDKNDYKMYAMIKKREHNPELSVVQNMILDLVDFKDRVRPLSRDISLVEHTQKFQKENPAALAQEQDQFMQLVNELNSDKAGFKGLSSEEGGYSSLESQENKLLDSTDVETSALEEESTIPDEYPEPEHVEEAPKEEEK